MENILLKDISIGGNVEGYFLMTDFTIKTTKSGKAYVDCNIQDNSEKLSSKLWAITNKINIEKLESSDFVYIKGAIDEYNNNRQIKLDFIRPVEEYDSFDKKSLIPIINDDPRRLFKELSETIQSIKDDDIRNLCVEVMKEKQRDLIVAPAARAAHHYEVGGLLLHIVEMLNIAKGILAYFPDIKRDYLFAGIVLHDIGKIMEMERNSIGLVDNYTLEGELLGHITIGINYIDEIGRRINFPEDKLLILKHMILSHHKMPEYGSPVGPMFVEAEMLHYCDIISSRIDMYRRETKDMESGELSTNKNFFLGSRVYKI